ncbi:hypothetical protein ACLOJK_026830, partial [Asimina triloba]
TAGGGGCERGRQILELAAWQTNMGKILWPDAYATWLTADRDGADAGEATVVCDGFVGRHLEVRSGEAEELLACCSSSTEMEGDTEGCVGVGIDRGCKRV